MSVAPRALLTTIALVSVLAAAACSGPSATSGAEGASAAAAPADTTPPTPDPLPDPQVGPGDCTVVTYTPPGAPASQQGELCRPAENQRDVAVMVVHGGSGIGGSREGMRPWARRLVAEGYVVFMPEYHLFTPGSNETPVFPQPEQDVKAAVQFLRGTANAIGIDRNRIVVQGQSAGARIGAVAFATPDDHYFDGPTRWPDISDEVNGFVGYYHPFDGSMQYSAQYYGGADDSPNASIRERWDKADSLAQADQVEGPALFITGSKDWSLQIEQQDAFASTLRQHGLEATTLVVEGGSHGFDQAGDRLTRLGEQAATAELTWLNDRFPQDPTRPPQTATPDLATAPDSAGSPPPTFDSRTRSSTSGGGGTSSAPSSITTTPSDVSSSTVPSASTTSTTNAPPSSTTSTSAATTTTALSGGGEPLP